MSQNNERSSPSLLAWDSPELTGQRSLQWIDISVPLRNAMVHWPSDPPVRIERVHDLDHGDTANLSMISMGSHTGTHVDAPLHFIRQGSGIDKMPIDAMVGRARVIEIKDSEFIKPEELASTISGAASAFSSKHEIPRTSGKQIDLWKISYSYQKRRPISSLNVV